MKKEQIKKLKHIMSQLKNAQTPQDREVAMLALVGYLEGVLDGIKTE